MSQLFSYQRLVEFADTDAAGIAHFSSLIQYMESAEHAFLRTLGLSVMNHATRAAHQPAAEFSADETEDELADVSWPRVKVEVDFTGAAYFEDLLQIDVSINKLGRSSLQYEFRIHRAREHEANQIIATGRFTTVCCKVVRGQPLKSIEIPTILRAKFLPFVVESKHYD